MHAIVSPEQGSRAIPAPPLDSQKGVVHQQDNFNAKLGRVQAAGFWTIGNPQISQEGYPQIAQITQI
jgi:hypothetical protein